MSRLTDELLAALRFLTRLPLPGRATPHGFGAGAFPLVGLVLGGMALVVDRLTAPLPYAVRDVLVLAVWAWMTGAIHYDGLADTFDALGVSVQGAGKLSRVGEMPHGGRELAPLAAKLAARPLQIAGNPHERRFVS